MTTLAELWAKLQGELLFDYFWMVTRTSRAHVAGRAHLAEAQQTGKPILLAFWHQQVMLAAHFAYSFLEPRRFMPVLVGDRRGIILDRGATRIGFRRPALVNMGGNPVAAGRSVLNVVRAMKRGVGTLIAPDGPDGPAFVPKPGMAFLAAKAEAVVLPLGAFSHPARQLSRWDRYLVSMPFSNMYYALGQPILPAPREQAASLTERVALALHAVRDQAQAMAKEK